MKTKDDILLTRIADAIIRDFYPGGVSVFAREKEKYIDDYPFRISKTAFADLKAGVNNRIVSMIKPAVSRYFLQYLNEKDVIETYFVDSESDSLDSYRDDFYVWITSDKCEFFRDKLPKLIEKTISAAKSFEAVILELFGRLSSSYSDICESLLDSKSFEEIKRISSDSGDVHNNGRTTSIITTDAGKLVYKPHDVRIDLKSYQLIDTFFSDVMKAPKVLSYDSFGFVEFIENKPSDTDAAARKYFYNLGGFVSIVQMLGSTDLHHNNVLANGDKPVVIDYELMITPSSRKQDDSLANDFNYSIYFSTLMPARRGDTELSILFGRDDGNLSAPVVDGHRKIITDYPKEFFSGFECIYRRCMEHKDEIKEYILSMKNLYVRHIYRGTKVYSELLQKTLEPAWVEAPDVKKSLFEALSVAMKRSGSSAADDITNAETDALLRGDIPYIYTRTDSCDLYADGRVVFTDFFRVGCIDNILSRIDYMSESDLAFEEALLRKSMERVMVRQKRDEEVGPFITETVQISDDELIRSAEDIFLKIADDAVRTPSGRLCWFGPDYYLETGMSILTNGLIDGNLGLAVFFSMVQRFTMDEAIRTRALELIDVIITAIEKRTDALSEAEVIYPNIENTSMSSGLAGKLMACRVIGRNLGDDRYMTLCRKLIRLIEKMDISYERTDIFNGLAGLLKVLCKYDELYDIEGVSEIVSYISDKLVSMAGIPYKGNYLWKTLTPDWAVSGAGHGQSGVGSALYLAGKRLGRDKLVSSANACFDFERSIYSKELKAWPDRRSRQNSSEFITGYCSGAPGIGINAIETGYSNFEEVISLAVESVLDQPLNFKDFLCCGNAASIEFLLQAGMALEDDRLKDQARTRMALVIKRARERGYYTCVTRSLNNVFSPNLFYGVSGIGYEMYRLAFPDETESILL